MPALGEAFLISAITAGFTCRRLSLKLEIVLKSTPSSFLIKVVIGTSLLRSAISLLF